MFIRHHKESALPQEEHLPDWREALEERGFARGNRGKDYNHRIEAKASGGQGFALDPPGPGRSWTWRNFLKTQVMVSNGPLAFGGMQGRNPCTSSFTRWPWGFAA